MNKNIRVPLLMVVVSTTLVFASSDRQAELYQHGLHRSELDRSFVSTANTAYELDQIVMDDAQSGEMQDHQNIQELIVEHLIVRSKILISLH